MTITSILRHYRHKKDRLPLFYAADRKNKERYPADFYLPNGKVRGGLGAAPTYRSRSIDDYLLRAKFDRDT